MKKNDKIAAIIGLVMLTLISYYYIFPNRNWVGKSYLEVSQNDGFAVVELFTSEGCSSCPPADKLLERIQKDAQGKNIYLLAFHVDYWDNAEWNDRFGDPKFTERQQQYANRMKHDLVYTPQFVVNGVSEFGGDDGRTLYSLVSNALDKKSAAKLKLEMRRDDDSLQVTYETETVTANTDLFIGMVQKSASSSVRGGENTGEMLKHVQIVRYAKIIPVGTKSGTAALAIPENYNANDFEVIGFLQDRFTGEMTGAAKAHSI